MRRHLLLLQTFLVLIPLALTRALLTRLGRWLGQAHPEIVQKTDSFRFPGTRGRKTPVAAATPLLPVVIEPIEQGPAQLAAPRAPRARRKVAA